MAKFSSRNDVIHLIKLHDCREAVLFLVEEQVKNAEEELLGCSPQDEKLRDKLVKAQTFRNFLTTLTQSLK